MDVYRKGAAAGLAAVLTITMPAVAAAAPAEQAQGKLVVLGDLGGGRSYARGINDWGDVVGISLSKDGGGYAPALWRHGRTKPIALAVKDGSPAAINNHGVVVGGVNGTTKLFVWRHGRTSYFQLPGRDDSIWASDINEREQVVGSTYNSTTFSGRAFVWDRGVFTNLPTPRGSRSGAIAVNDRGQILGSLLNLTTYRERAVIWVPKGSSKRPSWKRIDLGSLNGSNSIPAGINDKGQVIGASDVSGAALPHPFLWQNGKMIDLLGSYPAENAAAAAINDAGLVVGHIQVSLEGGFHAVIWRNGKLIDIGTAGYNSEALAVNNRGQVAGLAYRVREDQQVFPEPFRWASGRTKLFTTPYPSANLSIVGVDAKGRIVAAITSDDEAVILRSVG